MRREKKLNKMKEKIDRIVKRKPTAGTNGEVENLPDPFQLPRVIIY